MARTAPVPNLPPIPGMNPCTWLAAGGANAGGGSGDGSGGDGNGNADGNGEKGDPNDGGKDSGACGQGGNGGCTNCSSGASAGDPVDVQTGMVFTVPKADLVLPGAFELKILRSYSTTRKAFEAGMGFGWTHSLAWSLHANRRSTVVHSGDGRKVELPAMQVGDEVRSGAWGAIRAKDFYVVRPGNEFVHYFAKVDDTDIYRLRFVTYRKRGHLSLQYEKGVLARVVDSVGRVVLFESNSAGRIETISVPDERGQRLVFARYSYDNVGNMVAAADADGNMTRYAYDDSHRLKRLEYPSGITFHFEYSGSGLCTQTWGAYPNGVDPALAPTVSNELRDGSRAKGIYHCRLDYVDDYSEVVDSERLRRYFAGPNGRLAKAIDARGGVTTREFDDRGRVLSVTDPNEATWEYEYDDLDEVVRETDPEGNTVSIERDGGGRETGMVDAEGGRIGISRNWDGETESIRIQNGALQLYELGAYGRVLSRIDERGARHTYEYDAHANLVAHTAPTGARHEYTYDYWGRLVTSTDPHRQTTRFQRSAAGRPLAIEDRLGRVTYLRYDAMGNLVQQVDPGGAVTNFRYGGLNWQYAVQYPDGSEVETRYNREGWPLYIVNERGERYEFEYDPSGLVVGERDFAGRHTRYEYDGMGRVVAFDQGEGKFLIERNKVGQVIGETAPDGAGASYEFNRRGELLRAQRGDVGFRWRRDEIGEIVSEEISVDGATYTVDTQRDIAGDRVASRTSLGYEVRVARDIEGQVEELQSGVARALRIARDALGSPVRRELSEGAAIVDTLDAGPRLRHRQLMPPGQGSSLEPEYVGAQATDEARQYEYSDADELIHVGHGNGAEVNLEYDIRHHLLRRTDRGSVEEFRADGVGNYYEAGDNVPPRRYGAGSTLLRHADIEYDYDALGRLIAKRRVDAVGQTLSTTRFEWSSWGLLGAVVLADETRVEFQYDAFARRIAKRTVRDGAVVERHHYVWDLMSMVHDVKLDPAGKPSQLATYLYTDNDDETPIAQKLQSNEVPDARWVYYLGDIKGLPERLVDGGGRVLARYEHSALGKATLSPGSTEATPFRAPGQQEDSETGLFYNRYRYYDPESGSFISPDPIGLDGGLNAYSYGPNPIAWVDPLGWKHHCITVSTVDETPNPTVSGYHDAPDALKNQPRAHTEQKFVHDLLSKNKPGSLKDEEFTLLGESPPCPRCHAAMMRGAKESGAKINYKWKDKTGKVQAISYEGGTGKPSAEGDKAKKLLAAYPKEDALQKKWKFDKDAKPSDESTNDFWGVNGKPGAEDAYHDMSSDKSKNKDIHKPKPGDPYWSGEEVADQTPQQDDNPAPKKKKKL